MPRPGNEGGGPGNSPPSLFIPDMPDVASAAALGVSGSGNYLVTGTVTITSLPSLSVGTTVVLRFAAALTLTYNATSLILQGSANLTTAAGDVVALRSEGGGNWRELWRRLAAAAGGTDISAKATHSLSQSITNNTATILAFNTETFDTDTIHDNTTNNSRLTCKTAGKYLVVGHLYWASNATGTRITEIVLNGVTALVYKETAAAGNTGALAVTLYSLVVNDYVELRVTQSSGGALSVVTDGQISPSFMMVKVLG